VGAGGPVASGARSRRPAPRPPRRPSATRCPSPDPPSYIRWPHRGGGGQGGRGPRGGRTPGCAPPAPHRGRCAPARRRPSGSSRSRPWRWRRPRAALPRGAGSSALSHLLRGPQAAQGGGCHDLAPPRADALPARSSPASRSPPATEEGRGTLTQSSSSQTSSLGPWTQPPWGGPQQLLLLQPTMGTMRGLGCPPADGGGGYEP